MLDRVDEPDVGAFQQELSLQRRPIERPEAQRLDAHRAIRHQRQYEPIYPWD